MTNKMLMILSCFLVYIDSTATCVEYGDLPRVIKAKKLVNLDVWKKIGDFSNSATEENLIEAANIVKADIIRFVTANLPSVVSKIDIDSVRYICLLARKNGFDIMEKSADYLRLRDKTLNEGDAIKLSIFTPLMDDDVLPCAKRYELLQSFFGSHGVFSDNYELSKKDERYSFECSLFVLFLQGVKPWLFYSSSPDRKFYFRCLCGAIRKYLEVVYKTEVLAGAVPMPSSYLILRGYYSRDNSSCILGPCKD